MSTQKAKLTFIMGSFVIGGAERQWTQYLKNKPDSPDWDIEIITLNDAKAESIEQAFKDLGVKTQLIDRQAMPFPLFLWRLFRALQKRKPDIVHTVLEGSTSTWGRLCAYLAGVRGIMHSDRNLKPQTLTKTQVLLRPYLDGVTKRFLPNAHAIADLLISKGVSQNKIFVMPNTTDTTRFDPDARSSLRQAWGIAETAQVAGFLAAFRKAKRIDLLLDAMLLVPEKDRPDYLILAGDGPEMPMVKGRIEANKWLKNHTKLLGSLDNTPEFLNSIDYLILTSDTEGLPNVVLEAMAMRKPVVATNVSDVPLLIEGAGIVVEMGNAKSIAKGIYEMSTMPSEDRAALGVAGRQKVISNYAIAKSNATFWQHHADVLAMVKKN